MIIALDILKHPLSCSNSLDSRAVKSQGHPQGNKLASV